MSATYTDPALIKAATEFRKIVTVEKQGNRDNKITDKDFSIFGHGYDKAMRGFREYAIVAEIKGAKEVFYCGMNLEPCYYIGMCNGKFKSVLVKTLEYLDMYRPYTVITLFSNTVADSYLSEPMLWHAFTYRTIGTTNLPDDLVEEVLHGLTVDIPEKDEENSLNFTQQSFNPSVIEKKREALLYNPFDQVIPKIPKIVIKKPKMTVDLVFKNRDRMYITGKDKLPMGASINLNFQTVIDTLVYLMTSNLELHVSKQILLSTVWRARYDYLPIGVEFEDRKSNDVLLDKISLILKNVDDIYDHAYSMYRTKENWGSFICEKVIDYASIDVSVGDFVDLFCNCLLKKKANEIVAMCVMLDTGFYNPFRVTIIPKSLNRNIYLTLAILDFGSRIKS